MYQLLAQPSLLQAVSVLTRLGVPQTLADGPRWAQAGLELRRVVRAEPALPSLPTLLEVVPRPA
jgi:hypothetical protein